MNDPKEAMLAWIEAERRRQGAHVTVFVFEWRRLLADVNESLKPASAEDIAAVWTAWHELVHRGVVNIGWPLDKENWEKATYNSMIVAHVSLHGVRVLENVRRDPTNKQAYLAHVDAAVPTGSVARSYLDEALDTYASGCDRATAVLAGCASEAIVLELRDAMIAKYEAASIVPGARPVGLRPNDWQIATIVRGVHDVLAGVRNTMPRELRERFEFRWMALADVIRRARNDVGHPTRLDPITRDDVHALLLLFPESAKLTRDLVDWTNTSFAP